MDDSVIFQKPEGVFDDSIRRKWVLDFDVRKSLISQTFLD